MPLQPKHAKTCTIKFYIIITTVMKRICISVSMFSCVAEKTCKCMNIRALVIKYFYLFGIYKVLIKTFQSDSHRVRFSAILIL